MTKVLVVSRTRMGSLHCIGGITRDEHRNVRLCPSDGIHGHPADAQYVVGDVWDLEMSPASELVPPHVEDVVVGAARRIASQLGIGRYLRQNIDVIVGTADSLFEGKLIASGTHHLYVSHLDVPAGSVGFWQPPQDLTLEPGDRRLYSVPWRDSDAHVKYVGVDEPPSVISAGSLVRVSLARWFRGGTGPGLEGCWLQISGVYSR